jgi:hypothetical protein
MKEMLSSSMRICSAEITTAPATTHDDIIVESGRVCWWLCAEEEWRFLNASTADFLQAFEASGVDYACV